MKIGDRVKSIVWFDGEEGTIVCSCGDDSRFWGVKFESFNDARHDLGGRVEHGHGYYLRQEDLKLIKETNWRERLK